MAKKLPAKALKRNQVGDGRSKARCAFFMAYIIPKIFESGVGTLIQLIQ